MSETSIYRQKAEMFDQRADRASDAISKQHCREMAAHCRRLHVEHMDLQSREFAQ
jgi:hypothetical protein